MVTVEELPRFPASIDEIAEEKDEANHRFARVIEAAKAEANVAGVMIETHLVPGHVVDGIIGLIQQLKPDLLVVGFMGHSHLYERIIGGTTDRLVRLALRGACREIVRSGLLDVPHQEWRRLDDALDVFPVGGLRGPLTGRDIGHNFKGALLY
jgi:hypothetical protein